MLYSGSIAQNMENIKFRVNFICLSYTSALKMETSASSKISLFCQTKWCHITEDLALIHTEVGNKNIPFLKLYIAFWQTKTFPKVCIMFCYTWNSYNFSPPPTCMYTKSGLMKNLH
jgi:hypothetical protein